jgi:hypothetical protein
MRFARICTVIAAGLIAGCTEAVIMKHPDGRVAKCGPYDVDAYGTAMHEAKCIDDFKAQGFVRQPS